MDTNRIVDWLQVAANLAILVGIILVLVQIRQNTELVKHQILHDRMSDHLEAQVARMGEAPHEALGRVVENPESMTYSDFIVMDAMLSRYLDYHMRNKRLQDEGLYDDDAWRLHFDWAVEGVPGPFALYFGNPAAQAWWDEMGFWWDDEFDAAVAGAIAHTPDTESRRVYAGVMERVSSGE